MVDAAQILQTAGTAALQTILPQQPVQAAPAPVIVQAPRSSTNWLLWGGIAAGAVVGLIVLKKVMGRKASAPAAAAPSATNPRRRRRKVIITRRRR